MNSTKVLYLLIVLATLGSCKRKTTGNAVTLDINNPEFILKSALQTRNFNYDYISLKAKSEFISTSNTQNFTANIRMKQDEIIWSSVTALLGIEAARVLIEKDKVQLRNNLERKAYESDMSYLEQYTNTKLDIRQLQNLLVGNPIFDVEDYKLVEVVENTITVKAKKAQISNVLTIENGSFKIVASSLENAITGQKLEVNYSDFEQLNNTNFPKSVSLVTKQGEDDIKINMNYQDVSLQEITSFPYSVPSKYDLEKVGE